MVRLLFSWVLAFFLTGCTGLVTEDRLVGDWKVIDFKVESASLSPQIIEDGKAIAIQFEYELREDGGLTMYLVEPTEVVTGYWKFKSETKELSFYPERDEVEDREVILYKKPEVYKVEFISFNKFGLIQDLEGIAITTMVIERVNQF